MRVAFSPEAVREFQDAERHYSEQLPELGERFRLEVRAAVHRISIWPLSYPCERGNVRRLTLARFPYKVLYSIETDEIYVIAVAHQHREPDYWTDRIDPRPPQ